MGTEKYSRLIAGRKYAGRVEIGQMNRVIRTFYSLSRRLSVYQSTTCRWSRTCGWTCQSTWCCRACNRSMLIDMWAPCVAVHADKTCWWTSGRPGSHEMLQRMRSGHAAGHVEHKVWPRMQPEAFGLTDMRSCGLSLLANDFYIYPCLPSDFRHPVPPQKKVWKRG